MKFVTRGLQRRKALLLQRRKTLLLHMRTALLLTADHGNVDALELLLADVAATDHVRGL